MACICNTWGGLFNPYREKHFHFEYIEIRDWHQNLKTYLFEIRKKANFKYIINEK